MSEAPERIWAAPWRSGDWREGDWDDNEGKTLNDKPCIQYVRADRTEALTAKVKLMDDLDVINGEKIEALTAERDEANKRGDAWRFRADIAEAKLAKVVDAMEVCVRHEPRGIYPDHVPNYWLLKTTLEEIKRGEDMSDEVQEDPFHILVDKVVEHEDGGATYTFEMNHKATQAMTQYGLELVLICAAYGVDIQDAFDSIRNLGTKDE
jgi:hypothetical protein